MMSLPPNKKTASKQGSIIADNRFSLGHDELHMRINPPQPCAAWPGKQPPKPSADDLSHQEQEAIMNRRRVSVEEAAEYAGVSRAKMWELIHPEVNAVVNGHRPGTNRRWVDLDSIDELYRLPERMREAEDKIRRLRGKKDRGEK